MALEKLLILVEGGLLPVVVALFNPNQITIEKSVNWQDVPSPGRDVPEQQFTGGKPASLSMDLFFDTYESGVNVRLFTQQVAWLATVERHGALHRPPICRLVWGLNALLFQGFLQSLTQRFTLFLADGTPVRATLGCRFQEWHSPQEDALLRRLQSADVAKTRIVQRGDTLQSIAAAEYNDPRQWRPIAEANRIDDPRRLSPGARLTIPALRGKKGGAL